MSTGQINEIMNSTIIAALPHLRYLDLSFNDFDYSAREPLSFLGALKNLRYLNLSYAGCLGSISQLGNLSRLQHLDLSSFYVQYVSDDLTWLPHLSSLKTLYMSKQNFSSARDWVSKVNMLPNLKTLNLSSCLLNNKISRLSHSNLTHLEILDLSGTPFNSFLQHSWFWDVTTIKELYLSFCGWSGPIPAALGNMSSLEVLYIDWNSISGIVPMTLENLCSLQLLNLEHNNINADMIGRLPQCSWSNLCELHLQGANLTGQLPAWLGNLTSLSYLDLSSNMMVGSIPSGIGNMRSLSYLDLSTNMLVGSIPSGIGNMRSLSYLDLSWNMLVGSIPSGIGNLGSLSHLYLSHNMLVGSVPSGIGNMRSLSYLDLSHNMLDGDIPSGIGALSNLTYLILRFNNFSSVLSKQHFASLVNLENLDIEKTSLKLDFGEDWVPPFRLTYGHFGSCDMGPAFPSW
jgi:Leucine-rich repeat (LRR) protein